MAGGVSELLRLEAVRLVRGDRAVLQDVSLSLRGGEKVGLVGANGAGKSTLLALASGRLAPTDGRVWRSPGARVAELERTTPPGTVWSVAASGLDYVRGLEAGLRDAETRLDETNLAAYAELTAMFDLAGGYEAESVLKGYLSRLGFADADYGRDVRTLSSGQRARLALARTLAGRADLLLLDEPSTFLDLPTKSWLAETLSAYPGALLLASHDRALLDAVTKRTLSLEGGTVTSYRGPYSRFREGAGHVLNRQRREAARAAHERRSLGERARRQPTAAARKNLERRLARLGPVQTVARPPAAAPLELGAARPKRGDDTVLEARHLTLTRGDAPLFRDVSLRVHRGDKLALVGPNGGGKTSLLGLLAGEEASDDLEASVRLGRGVKLAVYDAYSRGLADGVPIGEQLMGRVSEPRARSLLALVGLEAAFGRPPESLSSGERARAGIALLTVSDADLLLLDEPSEYLDVGMTERLETALQDTEAAALLVSHDAALVGNVATRVLGLANGELREYRGGLAGFYAGTLRLEQGVDLDDLGGPAAARAAADAPDREADLEAELAALEDETLRTEELLADPTRLSERDRERLGRRLRDLTDGRSERYNARFPPPAPRYRVKEAGVVLSTNGDGSPVVMASSTGFEVLLYLDESTHVGHLRLRLLEGAPPRCPLPWAARALVRGGARLAFEVFGARAVQTQSEVDLADAGFDAAGAGWWVQDRERYAVREGLVRPRVARSARKRRLRHPQGWERWAARRSRHRGG